jgi:hypothetical protein
MILQGTTPRALTWTMLGVLLASGALLLPLHPMWGQERPTAASAAAAPVQDDPTSPAEIRTQVPPAGKDHEPVVLHGRLPSRTASFTVAETGDVEDAKDEVELLEVQLQAKKAEYQEAQALVEQARRQLERHEKLADKGFVSQGDRDQLRTELTVRESRLQAKAAQIREAEVRLRQARRRLARLQSVPAPTGVDEKPAKRSEPLGAPKDSKRSASDAVDPLLTGPKDIRGLNDVRNADQRLRGLERKLDALLKEVETLRHEMRGRQFDSKDKASNRR